MVRREIPGRRAPASDPEWLTLGQAAKYLGVAQSTIRKWSDQGRVPAFYTPGGHRRYRRRDLVLLDVMMPEMDGWEMLRRVQERHGVGAIPVVMFSGKVDEGAEEATARGAQGFLGKPFDPQQLIDRAKQLVPV